MSGYPFLVTADDRSGAMETAALLADAGQQSWVCSWDGDPVDDPAAQWVVADLRSRHLAAASAAVRARVVAGSGVQVRAHKMDSTLRGNWASELDALRAGRGVLLVPAYPSAGRTCEGGVVRVGSTPVGETEFAVDAQNPVRSSRPAEYLRSVGIHEIREVAGPNGVRDWLAGGAEGVCLVDARVDADVVAAVQVLGDRHEVLVVGTALTVAALAGGPQPALAKPVLPAGGVVVVCGSRHPVSRAQASAVTGLPGVTVLFPPEQLRADAEVVALELSVRAHDHVHAEGAAVVLLLGGDTADAFVGERAVRMLGSLAPGLAVGEVLVEDRTLTVLTKPGGFGHDRLLVDVLAGRATA